MWEVKTDVVESGSVIFPEVKDAAEFALHILKNRLTAAVTIKEIDRGKLPPSH